MAAAHAALGNALIEKSCFELLRRNESESQRVDADADAVQQGAGGGAGTALTAYNAPKAEALLKEGQDLMGLRERELRLRVGVEVKRQAAAQARFAELAAERDALRRRLAQGAR